MLLELNTEKEIPPQSSFVLKFAGQEHQILGTRFVKYLTPYGGYLGGMFDKPLSDSQIEQILESD